MALKYQNLSRANMRNLKSSGSLSEHGIVFKRLSNGDGRFSINVMIDGQRIHRAIGKESEGVTRQHVEDAIEKLRTDARLGRLSLPSKRKTVLGFAEAVEEYLHRLTQTGGKDLHSKSYRFKLNLVPYLKSTPLSKITTSDVDGYKQHRLAQGVKPGTINRELAALSHLFTMAIDWGWIITSLAK